MSNACWELIASIWICLLSTWNGNKLHSRPMGAFVRRNACGTKSSQFTIGGDAIVKF